MIADTHIEHARAVRLEDEIEPDLNELDQPHADVRPCPVCSHCSICGCAPCGTPGFCRMCREADRKAVRQRGREHDLPQGWEDMSLGALWERLNDPRRTSRSTVEAILYCVQSRGLAALKEPANLERLRRCDAHARAEIDRRVGKLFELGVLKR